MAQNSIFTAPTTTTQIDLIFQLTITNELNTTSKPDYVTVIIDSVSTSPPTPTEEPQTLNGIIKEIINNPLEMTDSMEFRKDNQYPKRQQSR